LTKIITAAFKKKGEEMDFLILRDISNFYSTFTLWKKVDRSGTCGIPCICYYWTPYKVPQCGVLPISL